MATTKKTNAKKTIGKVKSSVKKTSAKKTRVIKEEPMRSFHISRNDRPFLTTHVTKQTVYWSILLIFILLMQLWILNIQLDVIQITDSITSQTQSVSPSPTAHTKK